MGASVKECVPEDVWTSVKNEMEERHDQAGGLEKNSLFIADVLSDLCDGGQRFEVIEKLVVAVLSMADDVTATNKTEQK